MEWFISDVWPNIKKPGLYLKIYGDVVNGLDKKQFNDPNILMAGFIESLDTIYNDADIIINPVRFGAGLKIKNVEALGNGLPLVTTPHGVSGMEDAPENTFLIANTALEFTESINSLIGNYPLRKTVADNAYNYAAINFSEEACYRPLIETMRI